ncbi:GNAT family N-acetyltransferase [Winogradskya humida]|uniref:N-acetyltransferase n=1 Tax=Winogradskya humida TaxID=113566 RepID=A0ABQ3ZQK6_9ACTN|nr:GNAT family N-acetyltransferase [Actinoplanes humidus]GIE20859.1 N-acetyltransferase [Actinoplanes humidus]
MADLPEGYRLLEGPPPVDEYLALRRESGLSPRNRAQAVPALSGSWYACHVLHEPTGLAAGMGRIIGDGGWYFHIVDMAVLPAHQRKGLGDAVLGVLLDRIRVKAPPGAYVNLLADAPGRRLYARHGFVESAPESIGMYLRGEA